MKIFRASALSTQAAIILAAIIIGLSIFVTTWVFFGGKGNRQKLFTENPPVNKPVQPNPMTAEQIKKIQEQRMQQAPKPAATTGTEE